MTAGQDTALLAPALSVPARFATPRPLTDGELNTFCAIADALIPAAGDNPAATQEPGFRDALVTAAHARADAFGQIITVLDTLAGLGAEDIDSELRRLHAEDEVAFQPLSAVVAGAWLLLPAVRARIGYAGQKADPAPFELAVDEISSGILDPVLERGSIYRPVSEPTTDSPLELKD